MCPEDGAFRPAFRMIVGSCTNRGPRIPNRTMAMTRKSPMASHGVMLGSMMRQADRGDFLPCSAVMAVVCSMDSATDGSIEGVIFVMVVCSPVSYGLACGGR